MKQFLLLALLPSIIFAQQQAVVVGRCGGMDTIVIPSIADNDHDGMDDGLEQRLLEYFMPVIIQFDNETCSGPAVNGTGDSNLVVCHIYPLPAQYIFSASPDSVKVHPAAIAGDTALATGMIWYQPFVMAQCALLYGKDCGLLGHTADVEGFSFSLNYTGTDPAGWMYDTVMQHWAGADIQTVSHADTPCEHVETGEYKSALAPNGFDMIYASPDKHGNYLTIAECGSSFICNPACTGVQSEKTVKVMNIGEADAPLVTDLGTYYAAYAGEDPWSTANFLDQQNGSAGTIREKLLAPIPADYLHGQVLDPAAEICDLYRDCFACGDSVYNVCLASADTIPPGTEGFKPTYDCTGFVNAINNYTLSSAVIYPVPAENLLRIIYPDADAGEGFTATIYDSKGMQLTRVLSEGSSTSIDISELSAGFYILQITSGSEVSFEKVVIR